MSIKWTDRQEKVIESRGKNLLVSAAAGSGKTAVLVERIIQMITDSKNPIDIDKLLVVTFTNAAAAQMREKILEAIQKKSESQPDNEHLLKQQTYIHNAKITTIHSFCLGVIRDNFNEIEIDPSFRVADDEELILLKSDIIKEILEDYYAKGEDDFLEFIETYASGKGDDNIEELILRLFNFSMSHPWPDKWLEFCNDNYSMNEEEIQESLWMKNLAQYTNKVLKDYRDSIYDAINICKTDDGPYMYIEALNSDVLLIENIIENHEFDKRVAFLSQLKFKRLSTKRDEGVRPLKRDEVKRIRDDVKEGLKKLGENFYFQSMDEMLEGIQNSSNPTGVLIELTKEFAKKFAKAKKDINVIDFNDIEHFAFDILVKMDEDGSYESTFVAKDLAMYFHEIIIDEYQDSNLLQELILKSVSREQFDDPNIFMVGDVKQSIYKFRMAKPELFVEKYDTYSLEDDSPYQRINLDKNFRSRNNVLESINLIFSQIMAKHLGDIDYDEENRLYTGADYKELPEGQTDSAEVLLIDTEGEDGKELEANVIAGRIKELVDIKNGAMVTDKETGELRRARYSDIVILFRSLTGHAGEVEETLMSEGIPCYLESKEGYFNALEIRIILSLLSIIDNPIQDTPLAAVLKSPIVGINSMELAQIKVENPKESFCIAARLYANEGANEELRKKLINFFDKLSEYRIMATYSSIYDLLTYLLNDTGYLLYVTAMPSGEKRKANIEMLKEKAVAYENTSYTGVFNFIRYIEKLKKYKVDFAEASVINENDNTVRIMTIHKSKGLEFPIIILGGIGRKLNTKDISAKIVMHSEYGIGVDSIDIDLRQKEQTLIKKAIGLKLKAEGLSEELRVLYVALTRAKEKLIITGSINNLERQIQKWMKERFSGPINLPFESLINAGNYMDLIGSALVRHKSFAKIYKELGIPVNFTNDLYNNHANINIKWIKPGDIVYEKLKENIKNENIKENLLNWDKTYVYDEAMKKELVKRLEFVYPYNYNRNIHTKMSVSEIKKLSQTVEEEYTYSNVTKNDLTDELIPDFISGKEEAGAAGIGSAYHRILELLDFSINLEAESIQEYINKIVSQGKITQKAALTVNPKKILKLLDSDLGTRIINASIEGKLYREQQYVMGISANEINEKYDKDEMVLIQGIIDAYIEEDDLVIIDYKTDRVTSSKELVERYRTQLDYYQKALEQITGKKVKEKIIYSLHLGKGVVVK